MKIHSGFLATLDLKPLRDNRLVSCSLKSSNDYYSIKIIGCLKLYRTHTMTSFAFSFYLNSKPTDRKIQRKSYKNQ